MTSTLTTLEQTLITAATAAISSVPQGTVSNPQGRYTVGAACISTTGQIYTGINLFHFTGGPCAEIVAFANAVAAGVSSAVTQVEGDTAPRLTAVVAVGNDGRGVINPCGKCRQMMIDYFPDIKAIIRDEEELRSADVSELLPCAYKIKRKAV